ncbi:hypothetical protein QAD02_004049, partial [Eretmocerus hayati]
MTAVGVNSWDEDMNLCASDETGEEYHQYVSGLTRDYESLIDDRIVISSRKKHSTKHIDFNYIHDQDMSYYQESSNGSYYTNGHSQISEDNILKGRSMLGEIPSTSKEDDYDPTLDQELTKLLEEEIKAIKCDSDQCDVKKEGSDCKKDPDSDDDQYEDYFDDFPDDEDDSSVPEWYDVKRRVKMGLAKKNLENVSKTVCQVSSTVDERIMRIEKDHGTPLCKLDKFPKHPSFKKPWQNYWKFNCALKCKLSSTEPDHPHNTECETVALEYCSTKINLQSGSLCQNEIPHYVLHTVEVFQKFIEESTENYFREKASKNQVYEKPTWSYIKLRSNYKEELMMIVCGKGVSPLRMALLKYFKSGPGRATNVVSLYYINLLGSKKKSGNILPGFLYGVYTIKDKIGPISINYNPKTNTEFNSTEAALLGKNIYHLLRPTSETTILDIGCNSGTLSLMLAQKCDKVIGFSALDGDIKMAEEIKFNNRILNATFIACPPKEVRSKISIFVKKCRTMAIINLSTTFGKSVDVMKALRQSPTVFRVAVYGTLESREHRNMITYLTTPDDKDGDEFIPMEGCVLDKFPSIDTEFDILVIFERKSLIEASIEFLGSGPTVNLKEDLWNHYPNFGSQNKIKYQKGFGNSLDNGLSNSAPFKKPVKKLTMFDSPALPKEQSDLPVIKEDPTKIFGDFTSDLDPEALLDEDEPYVPLPVKKRELEGASYVPLRVKSDDKLLPSKSDKLEFKVLKKIYDFPSAQSKGRSKSPVSNQYRDEPLYLRNSPTDRSRRSPSPRSRDRLYRSPSPRSRDRLYRSPSPRNRDRLYRSPSPRARDRARRSPSPRARDRMRRSPSPRARDRMRRSPSPRARDRMPRSPSPQARDRTRRSPSPRARDRTRRSPSPRAKNRSESPEYMYRKEKSLHPRDRILDKSRLIEPRIKQERDHKCSAPIKLERRSPPIELEYRTKQSSSHRVKTEHGTLLDKQHQSNRQAERRIKTEKRASPERGHQTNGQVVRHIKCEKGTSSEKKKDKTRSHVKQRIKTEKSGSQSDREEGELSPESIEASPRVDPVETKPVIKSEPMDIDDPPQSHTPPIKREETTVNTGAPVNNVRVKTEPVSPVAVRIKNEPADLKASPISDTDELANMETPVHVPAALAQKNAPPPPSPKANFTINGFQFCLKPNQTFLSVKSEPPEVEEPSATPPHNPQIKQEPCTPEPVVLAEVKVERKTPELQEDEVEVVHVKSPKRIKVNLQTVVVKKEKEDSPPQDDGDLRELIRKRNELKKQLGGGAVGSPLESCIRHSPSPIGKRPRSPASPSRLYSSSGKQNSSTPPHRRRSPSPYSKRFRRSRSPSIPYTDRYRWRSPPRQRFKTSPPSRYSRSPSPRYVRSPSSRSPSPSRRRRSPSFYNPEPSGVVPKYERVSSPVRYRYSELHDGYRISPPHEKYRRSSLRLSPPPISKSKYSPPSRYRFSRSPSATLRAIRPLSPSSKSKRSPIRYDGRRSRSKSPIPRRKSKSSSLKRSRSPLSLSPSPSRDLKSSSRSKTRDKNHEKKKKKKKKRTASSPDASTSKKKKIQNEHDDWDIPGLSCLEDSPVKSMKPKVPSSSDIFIEELMAAEEREVLLIKEVVKEKIVTEEIIVEDIGTEEVVSGKVVADEVITEEVVSGKVAADEVIPEEVVSEKVVADE